ncbi:DUF5916 domain-containing protein [Chryseotalea sanaruensis]|uniref:DUF5916 domain-containing protein n=1 Tax=Chryseotalea sanaruensis TaxID=2482724 RepID=UPI000F8EEC0F|nr:DUF5916 domain-containing protein [Chryseotalea sanaruensis]
MKLFLILFFGICTIANCQDDSLKTYTTSRLVGEAPQIDGLLNDAAWDQVPWGGGDFRQNSPDAGAPATVQTLFKILYDSKNLYIIFKNLDPDPSKIVSRMSRRDGFEGDWVEINIDSYYDKRTAFSFTSSVSGVKGDEYVSNNGDNWDASWDPIWYMKTSINAEGWIAEMRIPLSQLRFAEKPELTWGIQITRRFFRNGERSNWQYIPPNSPGWVHLFGELKGIQGIKPQKQVEIQPYVVAQTETFEKEEGNPFQTGQSSGVEFGLDAKIGITSDITLDLTVNPDFGQVEADPSQVNLTAFELFFREQRPFFIEGSNTLNFPVNDYSSNNLFYSRRIGRRPQGYVDTDESGEDDVNEYVKTNNQSTILGAVKLTGKNKKGFSWGILETVTGVERAKIDSVGIRRTQVVEPMTNYFVARAQQDINKGNTLIGGMFTATNRNIEDPRLKFLHDKAYSGGIDMTHNWKERTYYVSAKTLVSHVTGDPEAITASQQSSERYFQRPDNKHSDVDPTRKSLTGTGGTVIVGKRSGNFVFDVGYNWLSPELELNDIGFLSQTDQMRQWTWLGYRILKPVSIFRAQRYNLNQSQNWDFDLKSTSQTYSINGYAEFKNFWSLEMGTSHQRYNVSNADLRGGPSIRYSGNFYYWFWLASDSRKKFSVQVNPEWQWSENNFINSAFIGITFNYTPINALRLSVQPNIYKETNQLQYVGTSTIQGEDRYVLGEIEQAVARVSLRFTYMVTPNLSIQYWGQPFGASGKYSNFKYATNPGATEYSQRFAHIPSDGMSLNGNEYSVDENTDGTTDYSFGKPDFNFGQFRSNMVIRWEYIPGSTFFLVWTQEMNGEFFDQGGPLHRQYNFDFNQKAHNIFLLKFTYRFVL